MPGTFSRRRLIKRLCGSLAAGVAAPRLYGFSFHQPQPPQGEEAAGGGRAQMFRTARAFMEQFSVPGLSVAVTRNGRFVYERVRYGRPEGGAAGVVL